MTRNSYRNLTVLVVGIVLAVLGVLGTTQVSHGSGRAWDRPVRCTMHVDGDGNASIDNCHTARPTPWWMHHRCHGPDEFNCYVPHGGDGGSHKHWRWQNGPLAGVFFAGHRHYALHHDYVLGPNRNAAGAAAEPIKQVTVVNDATCGNVTCTQTRVISQSFASGLLFKIYQRRTAPVEERTPTKDLHWSAWATYDTESTSWR